AAGNASQRRRLARCAGRAARDRATPRQCTKTSSIQNSAGGTAQPPVRGERVGGGEILAPGQDVWLTCAAPSLISPVRRARRPPGSESPKGVRPARLRRPVEPICFDLTDAGPPQAGLLGTGASPSPGRRPGRVPVGAAPRPPMSSIDPPLATRPPMLLVAQAVAFPFSAGGIEGSCRGERLFGHRVPASPPWRLGLFGAARRRRWAGRRVAGRLCRTCRRGTGRRPRSGTGARRRRSCGTPQAGRPPAGRTPRGAGRTGGARRRGRRRGRPRRG